MYAYPSLEVIFLNAVVFDLELVKRSKIGQLSTIVEIGACKVDFATKSIIDQLQIYIAPKGGYVEKSTRAFINMDKEDLKNAVPFQLGIEKFAAWLGKDYYLCSWGKDDRLHIIDECVRKGVSLDWFNNYNDIQPQIGKLLLPEISHQIGLKTALQTAGIEPTGKAHRGIDDAVNTAKLFITFIDQITLRNNEMSAKEISQHFNQKVIRARKNANSARPSLKKP
jgi:inhibitor of KinA sporulation pathway (predicted exonuclease)